MQKAIEVIQERIDAFSAELFHTENKIKEYKQYIEQYHQNIDKQEEFAAKQRERLSELQKVLDGLNGNDIKVGYKPATAEQLYPGKLD